jgi:hypothetical protein
LRRIVLIRAGPGWQLEGIWQHMLEMNGHRIWGFGPKGTKSGL